MAKRTLERKVGRIKQIKKQIGKYVTGNYEHKGYYLLNILKIAFGREPSHVSPNNLLVHSDLRDY